MILEIKDLHVHYGKIHALKNVSISVPKNAIVTIVGSNGAGKSTLLRTISGLVKPTSGSITFEGKDITTMPAHKRVIAGVVMTPEGRHVFPRQTVKENIELGAYTKGHAAYEEALELSFELFPRLKERFHQLAGTLSGGEQQMLAIARSLASKPKILLLDEPSMGLAPNIVDIVGEAITHIQKRGVTVLIVEQNIFMAFEVASAGYVIETGEIVLHGSAEELLDNEMVKKAYLGEIRDYRT